MATASDVTTLEMTYKTAGGKDVTYSLSEPRDDLTRAEVEKHMTNCIGKDLYLTSSGSLKSIVGCKLRQVVIKQLA